MKNKPWKSSLTAIMLGAMIVQGGTAVWAADSTTPSASAPTVNYGLTPDIRAAIKSAAVTPTASGSQLAVTVRLYNGGAVQNRVPEHELRVQTASGVSYTLKPSASNKEALQPKEIGELVYMTSVDSKEIGQIEQLSFVNVDIYSYPKVETTLLAIPTKSVWYGGTGNTALQSLENLAWGQAFTIPGVNSGLTYSPVEVSMQNTASGRVAVVTVLASNPGAGRETVPAFRMDAQSELKSYEGKRSEVDPVTLEAGEKKYIHFAIPVENGVTLSNLLVVSTDTFVPKGGGQAITLATGKLAIAWPKEHGNSAAAPYTMGQPITFDALTKVVDKSTEVSLMELHLHENPGEGYQTAVAKFKLTNTSTTPTATPAFLSELVNAHGVTYQGSRQTNVTTTLNPGLSYVVSYSYIVPQTEERTSFSLKLLDSVAAAPFTTTIAALQTDVQKEETDSTISLYPFDLTFNDVTVSTQTTAQLAYTYKFRLDLDIKQKENVVVDNNFSKLKFEIVDNAGRVVGSKDASFTGVNKLISGKQMLDATNITTDQFSYPFTVNVYETIETQNGTAKRLLKVIK
ncbi:MULTISPECIES: hypothetical protein [unclassified Paenibacillus]|uniref:hypothetical protein n=1 Tax=unclassified Paenibacillus TaxID=185978 RepID=UPI00070D38A6|nr:MULTISPECIES: hypothetical protein [unclassified Paenibacillus]KQX46983.1 hypothetical protein ASD40_17100 [Paenibacillus sp. Root444D2]KRE48319.1 hypothetical protein ASG85_04750 [Paenibacillus sp. Soil724D2]